MSIMSSGLLNI